MKRLPGAFAIASVLAMAVVVAACGSDDASSPSTPAPTDGGSTPNADGSTTGNDSGGTTSPDASGNPQCNDLKEEGTFVTTVKKPLPAPVATGGTIVPGKYVLTSSNGYTDNDGGGAGAGISATVLITSNTFDAASSVQGGSTYRATSTLTTNGNQFITTFVCYYPPLDGGVPTGSATQQYTASATELKTYLDFGALGGVLEYVYTKQ